VVDLSIGTPVDATPELVRAALAAAGDAPGYPTALGAAATREAAAGWLGRRFGVHVDPGDVLPLIGTKELIAGLPAQLGLGRGDVVAHPAIAYPTYDVGARLAGAEPVPVTGVLELGPRRVALVWVNSPANPTGQAYGVEHLRKVVSWARERGAIVASDECYLEFGWESTPVSLLHPAVCGGSHEGLLSIHALSKRSNMAGYRAGFVTGDPALVHELREVRKHAGYLVPAPVQAAMAAALGDDAHVDEQRDRYRRRRAVLRRAVESAGFSVDHSEAGLYLWATRGEPSWDSADWLAERGVLVAPGDLYGARGRAHVRVALTATDERVSAAAARITA
jgi:succinyldiaminopimelate transaminase